MSDTNIKGATAPQSETEDRGPEWQLVTIDPDAVNEAMRSAIAGINAAIERGEKGLDVKLQALHASMGVFVALIADGQYDLVAGALRMVGTVLERNSTTHAEAFAKARQGAN